MKLTKIKLDRWRNIAAVWPQGTSVELGKELVTAVTVLCEAIEPFVYQLEIPCSADDCILRQAHPGAHASIEPNGSIYVWEDGRSLPNWETPVITQHNI